MILVWGSGLYGNVDAVPGIGRVKTNFGHLYYIPLIPTGSHFIFEESSSDRRGVPIGLSFKSIFTAWLRVVLGFLAVATLVVGFIEIADKRMARWHRRMCCGSGFHRHVCCDQEDGILHPSQLRPSQNAG